MNIKTIFLSLITAVLLCTFCACGTNNRENSIKSLSETESAETVSSEKSGKKTEITIGIISPDPDIDRFISGFNNENENYQIIVSDYHDSDSTTKEMQNKLKIDITAGKAPDIILCENSAFYYTLSSKGTFTDISEVFSENKILPNIKEICTEDDGKIYRIPLGFCVNVGITKAENGSECCEIFSYDKMNEIIDSLDSGTMLSADMMSAVFSTKESILCNFTDLKNLTCSFNSPEFSDALEFYAKIKGMKYETSDDKASYINGKTLVLYDTLSTANRIYIIKNDVFNNENIAMTPPEHARLTLNQSIALSNAISEESKKGALKFINYILSDDNIDTQTPIWLPITESGLDISMNAEFTDYNKSEQVRLKDEDIKYFSDYIKSVNRESFIDYTVKNIFEEEAENYINGSYSAEECSEFIQKRVQLYLDEQK